MTEKPFAPRENRQYTTKWHLEKIEEVGLDEYERRVPTFSGRAKTAGNNAINKYKEKQDVKRLNRSDEREEELLEVAKQAQKQAEKSYQQSWIAIAIAGVAALGTIAVALLK